MRVCVYTYKCIHKYVYRSVSRCDLTSAHVYLNVHTDVCARMRTYVYAYVYAYIYIYIHMCICICIHVYVYMNTCVYIYT